VVKFNENVINNMRMFGIRIDDARWVDMYSEYERKRKSGAKVSWIVAFLAEKYGVSVRKVYDEIRRMKTDCKFGAV
jgi:hypothetical protein